MSSLPATHLDLSRHAPIWTEIEHDIMPRIAERLERQFRNRYGACPEGAVASAVRKLLIQVDAGKTFQSPHQIYAWLLKTAYRKLCDRLAREHLADRDMLPEDWATKPDDLAKELWEEARAKLDAIFDALNPEQRIVVRGKLAGKTVVVIAAQNGWLIAHVNNLWRQVSRLAQRMGPL